MSSGVCRGGVACGPSLPMSGVTSTPGANPSCRPNFPQQRRRHRPHQGTKRPPNPSTVAPLLPVPPPPLSEPVSTSPPPAPTDPPSSSSTLSVCPSREIPVVPKPVILSMPDTLIDCSSVEAPSPARFPSDHREDQDLQNYLHGVSPSGGGRVISVHYLPIPILEQTALGLLLTRRPNTSSGSSPMAGCSTFPSKAQILEVMTARLSLFVLRMWTFVTNYQPHPQQQGHPQEDSSSSQVPNHHFLPEIVASCLQSMGWRVQKLHLKPPMKQIGILESHPFWLVTAPLMASSRTLPTSPPPPATSASSPPALHFVIDFEFINLFLVARPTPGLMHFLSEVRPEFVGTVEDLKVAVRMFSIRAAESLGERSMSVAPWRSATVLEAGFVTAIRTALESNRPSLDLPLQVAQIPNGVRDELNAFLAAHPWLIRLVDFSTDFFCAQPSSSVFSPPPPPPVTPSTTPAPAMALTVPPTSLPTSPTGPNVPLPVPPTPDFEKVVVFTPSLPCSSAATRNVPRKNSGGDTEEETQEPSGLTLLFQQKFCSMPAVNA